MKFEKREITLNEYDSVLDLLFAHERLAFAYLEGLQTLTRKELRELFKERFGGVLDDVFLLQDLLQSIREEQA
jgi:hypothetical protein